MKILILSFYYPPDLSAGSFRTSALVKALKNVRQSELKVDVITTQPNRYADIADTVDAIEDHGWLRINRITLPAHQSGMKDQAMAFITFAREVRALTKQGNWDLVFATSSRLMTAALGSYVASQQRVPLYLDIRDLFMDTMADVLGRSSSRHLLPVFKSIEKRTFRAATRINVVSEGFLDHLSNITTLEKCTVFTNGIDTIFLETDFRKKVTKEAKNELPRVLYAGNIGDGQGLHNILPGAASKLRQNVVIRIVGDGGRATQLRMAIDNAGLSDSTIAMHPPLPRADLLKEYQQADILFLHLNNYKAFRKVLPSKIFEYAATGKPIVAGVAGHAAEFLKQHVPYAEIFDPCDVDGMVAAVKKAILAPRSVDRKDFCATFARPAIMQRMATDILAQVV